jgi:Zinc carboxypeptidase/Immune inhibitor A peptidase M6
LAKKLTAVTVLAAVTLLGAVASTSGAPGGGGGGNDLELYEATVGPAKAASLANSGYDVTPVGQSAEGITVGLVLAPAEQRRLEEEGVDLELVRDPQGRTQDQRATFQAANGFNVWRDYDGPDGIAREIRRLAKSHPKIAQLRVYGKSLQGRDLLAVRVTQNVKKTKLRKKPAVLYQATTHAREWISTEVDLRLLRWYLDNAKKKQVKKILKRTELWFVPVVNPDGYQYTFDAERLWRKNLRDNNGNGTIEVGDGVDINRNYPDHWGYDDEGSTDVISSDTYRGTAPGSEPEARADMRLFDFAKFKFNLSYHSYGPLLLYSQGWQTSTPSADDPVFVALTGTDNDPAVPGFDPGVGADLYTTNGEFNDWAHAQRKSLGWTPELEEGCEGCGFVFPDNEQLVQEQFQKNLNFALRVARSAKDPDDPVSHMGVDTKAFYFDVATLDPEKTHNPLSDLAVDVSYAGGSGQPVEVLAKRALKKVQLRYRINGGPIRKAAATPSPDGETFGGNNAYNVHYHYLRGSIPGLAVGDSVEYWFEGKPKAKGKGKGKRSKSTTIGSEHHTFQVADDADARVLIVAAEDRTGASADPPYTSTAPETPNYLSFYEDAFAANGISYDVYDVDASAREAPDHLGVLGHYDAVLWYTGNDLVTREAGWEPGNASRLANDMTLEMRQYLNEGGKLLYTGQWAGALENGIAGAQYYDPVANEQCVVGGELVLERCKLIADKNDFIQYYLGAYLYNSDAGTDENGQPLPVDGVSDPFVNASWGFNGADSAANQIHTASFVTTSSLLKPDQYPQFAGTAPAIYRGAAGAFEPPDGTQYMYSQRADVTYKRITRTIDLTGAASPTLSFKTSYSTEPSWDFLFVEAHTVGQDNWTTLPDTMGHTSTETGDSCAEGWFELHPWLERYQGADCSGSNPTTGGAWNAASGRSEGWEQWNVDLSNFVAGGQVEVSISYASDWGTQGVGVFVDDIQVSTGEGTTSFEEDGDPMDGWTVPGPQPGSANNPNDWMRTGSVGFQEGAVSATDDTLYFGFGFEGVTDPATRADVLGRSLGYLLP